MAAEVKHKADGFFVFPPSHSITCSILEAIQTATHKVRLTARQYEWPSWIATGLCVPMEAAALTAVSREEEHQGGRPRQDAAADSGLLSKRRTFSSNAALVQLELNRRHCLHHGTAMFPSSVHWHGYI